MIQARIGFIEHNHPHDGIMVNAVSSGLAKELAMSKNVASLDKKYITTESIAI